MDMVTLTIVLADGFAGEDVRLRVGDRDYSIVGATTALLTGMAASLDVEVDVLPATVTAELIGAESPGFVGAAANATSKTVGAGANAECECRIDEGETLVLSASDGTLTGIALPGPVGFA